MLSLCLTHTDTHNASLLDLYIYIYIYSARARYNKSIIFIPPPAHFSWVSTPPRNSTSPTCVISASHAPPITNMRGWVNQSLSYAHPPFSPFIFPLISMTQPPQMDPFAQNLRDQDAGAAFVLQSKGATSSPIILVFYFFTFFSLYQRKIEFRFLIWLQKILSGYEPPHTPN